MKTTKTYYHVIEQNYNDFGWHNCYLNLIDAEKQRDKLQDFFPECFFYIMLDPTNEEPYFITQ